MIDPTGMVASSATLDAGTTIFWQASVAPRCQLADHVLVSYSATVGHDCQIGYCSSMMPGANLSGDVCIGDRVLVGAGAVIREGVVVGDDAVVGAGAVVLEDVPPKTMVLGVPARPRGARGPARAAGRRRVRGTYAAGGGRPGEQHAAGRVTHDDGGGGHLAPRPDLDADGDAAAAVPRKVPSPTTAAPFRLAWGDSTAKLPTWASWPIVARTFTTAWSPTTASAPM